MFRKSMISILYLSKIAFYFKIKVHYYILIAYLRVLCIKLLTFYGIIEELLTKTLNHINYLPYVTATVILALKTREFVWKLT